MTSEAERGELTYRRVHHAPREVLFDCMTQPAHLTRFWGPAGTTTLEDRSLDRYDAYIASLMAGRPEARSRHGGA